jgi:hypothetical protein
MCTRMHGIVLFIVMHRTNFPEHTDKSMALYLFLIFGVNLPWTLSCVRNYIVVPTNQRQRRFTIVYDVVVGKPSFRNHIILQVFSTQG